jgi:hypothetical protein
MTIKNTTIATATATDLAQEAKNAVETSPSYSLLIAAKAKEVEFFSKANSELEEIERLNVASRTQNLTKDAKDMLAGKPVVDKATGELIQAAHRRLVIVREAISIQTGKVRELENQLSGEVNAALKKTRAPIVARMADALMVLREAHADNTLIAAELNKYRVITADNIAFVPVSQAQYDTAWLDGVKAQGYTV